MSTRVQLYKCEQLLRGKNPTLIEDPKTKSNQTPNQKKSRRSVILPKKKKPKQTTYTKKKKTDLGFQLTV